MISRSRPTYRYVRMFFFSPLEAGFAFMLLSRIPKVHSQCQTTIKFSVMWTTLWYCLSLLPVSFFNKLENELTFEREVSGFLLISRHLFCTDYRGKMPRHLSFTQSRSLNPKSFFPPRQWLARQLSCEQWEKMGPTGRLSIWVYLDDAHSHPWSETMIFSPLAAAEKLHYWDRKQRLWC